MSRISSFKVKLALFFALVALAPLAVAAYGYARLARQSQEGRADARLQADLRGVAASYRTRLDAAGAQARGLAAEPALARALRTHDRTALARLVRGVTGATVSAPGLRIGTPPAGPVAESSVVVVSGSRPLGRVAVAVRLVDDVLGGALATGDRVVAIRPGTLAPGASGSLRLGGIEYRGLATAPLGGAPKLELAVLTPARAISDAVAASERRLAVELAAILAILVTATYLVGRLVVGSLRRVADTARAIAGGRLGERVEVRGTDEFAQLARDFNHMAEQLEQRLVELEEERERVRSSAARFGAALGATHAPDQLLQVVVESAVEATGAAGGTVRARSGAVAAAGDPCANGERIAFPLRAGEHDFGTLELVGAAFGRTEVETATSLAAQAVVALENARLHRVVERQARVDGLTGLANRRHVDEILRREVARAGRSGDELCLVLCDLDGFKGVNDRFGHPCGDRVLQAFAATLAETVRETDTAARWGGEEFALVLPATDLDGGAYLAERARHAIELRDVLTDDGDPLPVTASFGVARLEAGAGPEELVAAADAALYEAKRAGKNRVVSAQAHVRL